MRGLFRVRKNENESKKKVFHSRMQSFGQVRMCHEGIKGQKLIGTISRVLEKRKKKLLEI